MSRIEEKHLVLPSLYLMSLKNDWYISTSELKEKLPIIMKPVWEDLEQSDSRPNETKFIQKIWNLKSHETFLRYHFASHEVSGFKLTEVWKEYLNKNIDIIEYLVENDFDWDDIKDWLINIYVSTTEENKKVEPFDENIIINEWIKVITKKETYLRSTRLRNFAIDKFINEDWKLYCNACNFSFDLFYWEELSLNYIEIHHKKPIFKYEWEDLEICINNALENLVPVCSNCHRMLHKKRNNVLQISNLIEKINANWVFTR